MERLYGSKWEAGIKGGRTVNNIQEATSEPILGKRMLEAGLPSELLEVADPGAGKQRFCR